MQTTTEQQTAVNADLYRENFGILSNAAIGVIVTRTREPYRVLQTLKTWALAEETRFAYFDWTVISGWRIHNMNDPDAEPTTDNAVDPFVAMKAITDVNNTNIAGHEQAIYAMMYVHKHLSQGHPGMIQLLKDYVRLFAENKKRLVLVMPMSFQLPMELEDDVVILDFESPSQAELEASYENLMTVIDENKRPRISDETRARAISLGGGMTTMEYENALSRALVTQRANLGEDTFSEEDFLKVIATVKTEVVKRSEVLELMTATSMSEVGGLDLLKVWIEKRARAFSDEAYAYGIEPPKGIALIGPPGTGKSLAAKAISSILGLPLIRFDISRVFKSLVGESEARVRAALKMVDAMSPCVLMIDEVDKALGGAHGSNGDSGVSSRVLGSILTWMQDTKSPVFVVVTANRTANLPSEFLRRGRLDEVFSVTVPNDDERLEILKIHLRKRGHNPNKVKGLKAAVDASAGYVPAELEAAVKDALIEAFNAETEITGDLIAEQLSNMQPLSIAFADDFNAMRQWAEQNARPASSGERPAASAAANVRQRTRGTAHTGKRNVSLDG